MIIEHKELEKSDFLMAVGREGSVDLIIDNVSDVKKSKYHEDSYYVFIDFKITSTLIYLNEDLKDSVCGISYPLTLDREKEGYYRVKDSQNIYPLLVYSLIKKGIINESSNRIRSSFSLTEEDLKENLEGLEFKGELETKNNKQILKPIKEG